MLKYTKKRFIGSGLFTRVYLIYDKETHQQYACKIFKDHKDYFLNEVMVLSKLNHPNIIKLIDSFEENNKFYILTELCVNGNLAELINERKGITIPEIRYCAIQIINGLSYIHSMDIIHRDLKLQNIFVDEEMNLKIGDFGLSTNDVSNKYVGTIEYMAPEIIERTDYTYKVDIWSIGIIIYILYFSRNPFYSGFLGDTQYNIMSLKYTIPEGCSAELSSLITQILVKSNRPELPDILNHKFFDGQIIKLSKNI